MQSQNETLEILEIDGMGQLKLVANYSHRYGFTSKGRGTVKTEKTYSVYFLPVNADLDIDDIHNGTRKADAVKAFKKASKQYQSLESTVKAEIEKRRGASTQDNVIFVDFRLKKKIA